MLTPRLTRVFASRWSALWWAGGMLLLAWQVAGPDDSGATGADISGISSASSSTATTTATANPWAVDPH